MKYKLGLKTLLLGPACSMSLLSNTSVDACAVLYITENGDGVVVDHIMEVGIDTKSDAVVAPAETGVTSSLEDIS